MQTREFTESDWWGFQGCSKWQGGDEPLISVGTLDNGKEYVLVFDPTGACLVVDDHPASESGGWVLPMTFPTQAAARAFATGIPEPHHYLDLLLLGFEEA